MRPLAVALLAARAPALLAWLALVPLATVAWAPMLAAQEQVVRVYNWSDYIDPEVLEGFTAETGIKVVYDVYDSNEILETKLLAGNSGYDVVVPTSFYLARQIEAGIFQPLDKTKLPSAAGLDPDLMGKAAVYDPGNQYAVIWMYGTTGIAYNKAAIAERMPDAPVDSWRMLLDPAVITKFEDCGIYMLDTADEAIPVALNFLGLDPNSTKADELERAAALLKAARPSIRKFHSSESINALASGDICLAQVYSGDAGIAATRAEEAGNGIEIGYSIPKEGALLWFDMMAIPKDAPSPENALKFIDYVLRPENIAKSSNFVTYPNAVPASYASIDEDVKSDTSLFPTAEGLQKLYTKKPYSQREQRTVTRLWQSITTGR